MELQLVNAPFAQQNINLNDKHEQDPPELAPSDRLLISRVLENIIMAKNYGVLLELEQMEMNQISNVMITTIIII